MSNLIETMKDTEIQDAVVRFQQEMQDKGLSVMIALQGATGVKRSDRYIQYQIMDKLFVIDRNTRRIVSSREADRAAAEPAQDFSRLITLGLAVLIP